MIVPIHTTRTVHVPYDAGGKPEGWDKLSATQKEWALEYSSRKRVPVWSCMDDMPSDRDIDAILKRELRNDRIALCIILGFVGLAIASATYYVVKPDCWWPVDRWDKQKCYSQNYDWYRP